LEAIVNSQTVVDRNEDTHTIDVKLFKNSKHFYNIYGQVLILFAMESPFQSAHLRFNADDLEIGYWDLGRYTCSKIPFANVRRATYRLHGVTPAWGILFRGSLLGLSMCVYTALSTHGSRAVSGIESLGISLFEFASGILLIVLVGLISGVRDFRPLSNIVIASTDGTIAEFAASDKSLQAIMKLLKEKNIDLSTV